MQIVNATAGANSSNTALSFDDNEVTNWSNDGQLNSAWINYTFDRPATISEVTLKLASWRITSYPLRISVDGKVVFEGKTAPSLGYVTITFPPAHGRELKLGMTAAPVTVDSLGNIIGVLGNKDVDDKANPKATLTVVEIEIYELIGRGPGLSNL